MKNIHVLATDKPSRLHLGKSGLVLCDLNFGRNTINGQNICITSDEKIKDGDWRFNPKTNKSVKVGHHGHYGYSSKKIILTTDQDLIKDGVQAIDGEFLQWFVKNSSCERVEVEKLYKNGYGNWYKNDSHFIPSETKYKIIIPQEEPKLINNCPKCGLDLVEREGSKPVCTRIDCGGIILSNETLREWALKEEPKQTDENGKPITYWGGLEEPKQEIVGYRLNSKISRLMVDRILQCSMPIWNDEDKSVYFIRGHVGGSLVAKMKELKVLDLWFTPIYESEEVKSDWIKEHHIDYYKKEGMMADKPKQETLEEFIFKVPFDYNIKSKEVIDMCMKEQENIILTWRLGYFIDMINSLPDDTEKNRILKSVFDNRDGELLLESYKLMKSHYE